MSSDAKETRITTPAERMSSVTVSRSPSDTSDVSRVKSLRLTVKMPSSKLREATSGNSRTDGPAKHNVNVFAEPPIITGPRNSRSTKKMVEVDTSDEDDLDDHQEQEYEVDDEDVPEEEDDDMDDDDDDDDDDDVDMDDAPPQPPVSRKKVKPPRSAPRKVLKSVEAKEMEDNGHDEDEDELSELDSDADAGPDDYDESAMPDDMADANGEDEELDEDDDEEDEDDEVEGVESEATPGTASRTSTPDYNRLTKRQRGSLGNDFLQLPMEPQVKKHLTAEERAMRRAEMARRRKNLSEKRNEEEKMDTINRLLRKQAPKRRGKIIVTEAGDTTPAIQEVPQVEKPDTTMARWVSNRDGCRVGVPDEWLGTPTGRPFGNHQARRSWARKLVEEV